MSKLYALSLFLLASNSARFECWVSKWRRKLYSFGTETTYRLTKHSAFEVTTVSKHLVVHFELHTLLSLLMFFFSCIQSLWYAMQVTQQIYC